MRFLKDPEPVVFEDRLHSMVRFDPIPEGSPYNDHDPFAPYYFCPEGMGFQLVYGDIVELLRGFTTSEVAEIRSQIIVSTDMAKAHYRAYVEEALPGRTAEDYAGVADFMRENRKYELLRMFPPEDTPLSTGKIFTEVHLWAVYALEEFKQALDFAAVPPFADSKRAMAKTNYIEDMLDIRLPGRLRKLSDLERANRAIGRQRSTMMDASNKLVLATRHIQYALVLMHSNRLQQEREAIQATQSKRMKGLNEINRIKDEAMKKALALASSRWEEDVDRNIRVGDMADIVYRALAEQGLQMALPGTSDRLKEWIKPVAPDYARKGGRSKKTTIP